MMASASEDSDAYIVNFWPAFSDVMLAIVLVLALVMGLVLSRLVDIGEIERIQNEVAENRIFEQHGLQMTPRQGEVEWLRDGQPAIRFVRDPNNPLLQRITFSDFVLFDSDDFSLKPEGRSVLLILGQGLRQHSSDILEIQIRGHADSLRSFRFRDNLELASQRANEVFRAFHAAGTLDPLTQVISATSFGEWVPTDRTLDRPYSHAELDRDNADEIKRRRNRRIEMLVFYRLR